MNRIGFRKFQVALTLFAAIGASANAAEFKPGEVIVKYRPGALRTLQAMNRLYDAAGVQSVRRYSKVMSGIEQLVLDERVKVQDAIAELQRDPAVEYAQPNYILRALPVLEDADQAAFNMTMGDLDEDVMGCFWPPFKKCRLKPVKRPPLQPAPADVDPPVADAQLSKAYGLEKISAIEAWKTFRGDKAFLVADIDTGIDYNHEDLSFNMWRNPKPDQSNDVVGYDFVHNDGLPFDDHQHGTHTAGSIGAVGGNGIGVSGVAQRVSIMALKFLTGDGSGTTADAIRAIDYAINHGAKVLSNSWGGKGDEDNKALYEAIDRARLKDVLFVAAAGNDGTDNDGNDPSFPAAFDNDNIITVAATDAKDRIAFFSNYGKESVDVAAPGVSIYSTLPGNKYGSLSGTSMACPHVAGAAALVWAKNPTWTYKQVKAALLNTVDVLPSLQGKTVTGGRINVLKALGLRTTD